MSDPTNKVEGYETIHKKGSRFGQDLTEAGVEALLKGGGGGGGIDVFGFLENLARSLPQGLMNLITSIPNLVIDSFAWAAQQLWGESKEVPYPESPNFTAIPEKMLAALEPLKQEFDKNIAIAEKATGDAEKINDAMKAAFESGEGYSGDLQLQWNTLVNKTDDAQNQLLDTLKLENFTQTEAITALTKASMRSGRIVIADREQAVNDGYVRVDNPLMSSATYVTARDDVSKWYGNIVVITQWRQEGLFPPGGGSTMIRSGWVEEGKLVGKDYIYLNRSGGHIEHAIAIYSEIPKEEYLEYKRQTTVDNH